MRRWALLSLLVWLLGISHAVQAETVEPRRIALGYLVYVGGFEVVGLDVDIGLERSAYEMSMDIATRGVVGQLWPWSMRAYSEGRLRDGRVEPVRAGQSNNWRGRKRWVRMAFTGGSPSLESIEPPAAADREVPLSALAGAVDVASALLMLVKAVEDGAPCGGRFPIFDGRRRYDAYLSYRGTDRLDRSAYSAFEGRAMRCEIEVDRIAGFRPRESEDDSAQDFGAVLWLGRPFADAPPIPVRLEVETGWGPLRAHLAVVDLKGGRDEARLTRKR